MDKSEINIKMLEKADEIQALRPVCTLQERRKGLDKWEDGDWIWDGKEVVLIGGDMAFPEKYNNELQIETAGIAEGDTYYPKKIVWLPDQSQLQEMIDWSKNQIPQDWLRIFQNWVEHHGPGWIHRYGSLEQLWMAFVMKEKYNKVWDGEDWIKESQ